MNLRDTFARLLRPATGAARRSLENPSTPLSAPSAALVEALGGGGMTGAGIVINERKAMTVSAVYACVRVIAESLASLPLITYERLDRGKQRAPAHPVYRLLHDRPNPEMTPFQFIETLQAHVALTGNAYAEIEWNGRGQPIALWPLTPDRVTVVRENGRKLYRVSLPDGKRVALGAGQVLHVPGMGYDGLVGYSPVTLMRQSLAVSLAAEEFGARFFGNGSSAGGVLTHTKGLSPEAKARLAQSWDAAHSGLGNAHRTAVLEEGMDWKQIQIAPENAQFLETRKFQVSDVARIFRVPPHLIGDLEKATFSNIEQQQLEFVMHTIRPWAVRWEQIVNYELYADTPQGRYFSEFLLDALLRGDQKSRYEAFKIGRDGGWLSANEIREKENENPLPGDQGDIYLVPLNSVPADQLGQQGGASAQQPTQEPDGDEAPSPEENARAWRSVLGSVFADAEERVVSRETNMAARAAKKGGELRNHLDDDHSATVVRLFTAPTRALVHLGFGARTGSPLTEAVVRSVAEAIAAARLEALRAGTTRPDALDTAISLLQEHLAAHSDLRTAA